MDRQSNIIITEKPKLRQPHMVCGIGGWVDGGEAATGSIRYLIRKLRAKRFAEIPIDKFHIFQVPGQISLRPHIRVEDGILKEHRLPRNHFFYSANPNANAENDVILFRGTEPNLNWEEYADTILNLAEEFAVARIYLLGGVLDKIPHTREPSISCSCSSEQLKEEMRKYGVRFSSYEGPGSFGTTLLYMCQDRHMQMVNIMTRATYYPEFNINIPHNPRAIKSVMMKLNDMLHLNLDTSDLDKEADEIAAKIELMASNNSEFRTYIEELENDFAEVQHEEPLNISANEAVQIAEELLKGNQED